MQEWAMLYRAPVAAKQGGGADEIDGARDPAAATFGHDQDNAVAHFRADQRIELPREIGSAPFARAGLHVESKERVPYFLGQIGATEPMHRCPVVQRVVPLAADGLAFSCGQGRKEVVEPGVARILPVELPIGALEKAGLTEKTEFRFGSKRDVNARGVGTPG